MTRRQVSGAAPPVRIAEEALALAERTCQAAGEAWTTPRRRAYELLLQAEAPRRAYDLIAAFAPGRRAVSPATVYRALEFLIATGLAHRIECGNTFVACATPGAPHTAAFLICERCGRAHEFMIPESADALQAARTRGFATHTITLELKGRCPECSPSD